MTSTGLGEMGYGLPAAIGASFAQNKGDIIDSSKHYILKAPHPSPLSAYNGFFGCGHFSKSNNYLYSQKKEGINWNL